MKISEGEGGEREINSPSQSTVFDGKISHHHSIDKKRERYRKRDRDRQIKRNRQTQKMINLTSQSDVFD